MIFATVQISCAPCHLFASQTEAFVNYARTWSDWSTCTRIIRHSQFSRAAGQKSVLRAFTSNNLFWVRVLAKAKQLQTWNLLISSSLPSKWRSYSWSRRLCLGTLHLPLPPFAQFSYPPFSGLFLNSYSGGLLYTTEAQIKQNILLTGKAKDEGS